MRLPRTVRAWGASDAELASPLPCDALVPGGEALVRAVDVDAPPSLVFRWLCQLRVAPYSYDLLDNLGCRSPQRLTPGLEELAPGQPFMTIFRLREHERDRRLTLEHRGVFGHVGVTYTVTPRGAGTSRLLLRLLWAPTRLRALRAPLAAGLATGDLVMARRQLLNLKGLAERDARGTTAVP